MSKQGYPRPHATELRGGQHHHAGRDQFLALTAELTEVLANVLEPVLRHDLLSL